MVRTSQASTRRHTWTSMAVSLAAGWATACHNTPAPQPVTTIESSSGRVTITGSIGERPPFVIRNAETRVRVDGQLKTSANATCQPVEGAVFACDIGGGVTLTLHADTEAGGLLLSVSVRGSGHVVDGFEVITTRASDAGVEPAGQTAPFRYLHNGYQSWSFSGTLDLADAFSLPRVADAIAYTAPNGNVAFDEHPGLSSHSAILRGGDGSALLTGFVTANVWQGAIALETAGGLHVTAQSGFTGDSLPIAGEISSETLFLKYAATPEEAMTAYGEALARRQAKRPTTATTVQRGWFSWNRYFEKIDEATLVAQVTAMKDLVGGDGFTLAEIDDGWEQAWGNWQSNGKFKPVAQLATDRHTSGQTFGLWLAPFVVEGTESVVAEHPEWWVKNRDGTTLIHAPVLTSHSLRVVDLTHPEALAWAVGNLSRLQQEGVDFFKLDYLYAAALDGRRHDPNATGVAALTKGLDAVFAAIGPASVNLCGVPWLHAVLAPESTIRVGTDVAFAGPYGFALVGIAARSLAARAYGTVSSRSDPDQFWLAPLTLAETRTAVVLQALAAGSFSLTDDFGSLTSEQKGVIKQLAAVKVDQSQPIIPSGLFDEAATEFVTPVAEVLSAPSSIHGHPAAVLVRGDLIAVTNWGDAEGDVPLKVPAGTTLAPVSGNGAVASGGSVHLPAHDTVLFRVSP